MQSGKCPICHAPHKVTKCNKFLKLTPKKRRELLESFCICYMCLEKGHVATSCNNPNKCKLCGRKHHEMLHLDPIKAPNDEKSTNKPKFGRKFNDKRHVNVVNHDELTQDFDDENEEDYNEN